MNDRNFFLLLFYLPFEKMEKNLSSAQNSHAVSISLFGKFKTKSTSLYPNLILHRYVSYISLCFTSKNCIPMNQHILIKGSE